jgi:hypothetical protein
VRTAAKRALRGVVCILPLLLFAAEPQATVDDSGSTNLPGLRVTFDRTGHASVQLRTGEIRKVHLSDSLCRRFMHDLSDCGPLNMLPAKHCMKSASFGSRLTVEFQGERSPDLSCPGAENPHIEALQKDAHELLQAARQAADIHGREMFSAPAPHRL